jgi:diguanylate cyclase (GGDEF)-like protein
MEQRLTEELSKARRYNFQLSVLLLDLDYFKRVNDEHGHQAGDQLLIEFSAMVNAQLRDSDILARYGGEEFLIIAPNTGPAEAALLAERLRARTEAQGFLKDYEGIQQPELNITVSIGLASFGDDIDNEEILVGTADRNLYQAKNDGRNRIAAA